MSEESIPKVDFKDRQKKFVRWLWKYLFPIIFAINLVPPLVFLFLASTESDSMSDSMFLLVLVTILYGCVVLFFIAEHQAIYIGSYNLQVHRVGSGITTVLAFCFLAILPLFLIFFGWMSLVVWNKPEEWGDTLELIGEIGLLCSFLLLLGLLVFIVFWELYREARRDRGLRIYPRVLASAERNTDEYLDGYSPRPVEFDFVRKNRRQLLSFGRFLLRHELVIFIRGEKDSLVLFFPVSSDQDSFFRMRKPTGSGWRLLPLGDWGSRFGFMMYFKQDPSYIRFFWNGRVEVYVTRQDYDFLKVPISYHLFCRKVAERVSDAYRLFIKGDELGALELFRVDRRR